MPMVISVLVIGWRRGEPPPARAFVARCWSLTSAVYHRLLLYRMRRSRFTLTPRMTVSVVTRPYMPIGYYGIGARLRQRGTIGTQVRHGRLPVQMVLILIALMLSQVSLTM